jgi:hypothetical protein
MRELDDARRSLGRYMWLAFPDYDVFIHRDEQVFDRPGIVIRTVGDMLFPPGGGWAMIDVTQPFAVYLYPQPQDSIKQSEAHATLEKQKLAKAFSHGLQYPDNTTIGGHRRVPLWDYEGVPIDAALPPERVDDVEYMRTLDMSITQLQEGDDDRLWTLVANVRLTWRQHGLVELGSPLVESGSVRGVNIT